MESPPPTYEMTFHTQSDTAHALKLKKRTKVCIILSIFLIIFFVEGSIAVLTREVCPIAKVISAWVLTNSASGVCIIFLALLERFVYNEIGCYCFGIIFWLVVIIFLFYVNIVAGSSEIIFAAIDNQKFLQTERFYCSKTFYVNTILSIYGNALFPLLLFCIINI